MSVLPPRDSAPLRSGGGSGAAGGHPPAGGPLAFTFGSWFTWTAVGIAFPLLGLLLVASAGLLARGAYEAFPVLAATHVATLGWGTMTIMGAAAQMGPVLLGARVRAERLLPWQYAIFTLGVLLVALGFAAGDLALVIAGGVGVNLGVWVFLVLMASTIVAARPRRGTVSPHLPLALVCLALVLLWGTMLAADLRWGFWPALLIGRRGLIVHLTLGLGGWFGLMVVGTFYRLVPLVHGARIASPARGWAILLLGALAILAALAGAAGSPAGLAGSSPAGLAGGSPAGLARDSVAWASRGAALAAAGALLLFCWEILHVLAHRRSRVPDLNVSHWHAVVGYSVALALAGIGSGFGWLRWVPQGRLSECVVVIFLLGWVTQAIIGQLYKVTPFLMWYYRATIPDVLAIPRQAAPYNPLPGRVVLWLSNAGTVGLVAGIALREARVAQGGAVLFAGAAFVLAYLLAYRWVPPAVTKALVFEWRWRIS